MSEIRTEHVFDADAAPEEVWAELRRARDEALDSTVDAKAWWLPGWTSRCTVLSQTDDSLTLRKDDEPCAGTAIVVEIEHLGTGSRIRVVQSGFEPGFVAAAGEAFWGHARKLGADFELFVRHGVLAGRAWRWPRVDLGFTSHSEPSAVVVDSVASGSWADTVGLETGDLLLVVAGASVFTPADLQAAEQTVAPGDEVEVTFAHGRELQRAVAAT